MLSTRFRFSQFIIDLSSLLSSKLFVLLLDLLGAILIARLLGPEKKGIVTVVLIIPTIFMSFADLGLRQSTIFFLGKKLYSDQEVISSVVFMIWFVSLIGIIITSVIYLFLGYQERYGFLNSLIPLALIPAILIYTYSTGILLAKMQIKKTALLGVLNSFVYLIITIFFYLKHIQQVELILIAKVGCTLFPSIVVLFMIKEYGVLRPVYEPVLLMNLLRTGIVYALALFVVGLNYNVDMVILERLKGSTAVGIYSVGVNIANMIWVLPNVIATINFSYSANAKDELNHAAKTARLLRMTLWLAVIPLAVLYIISPKVIPWIFTEQYEGSGIVVRAIMPGIWAMLIFKILNSDLAGRGRPSVGLWVFFLALVLNIALNYWWIPLYGPVGSAWASTASYLFGAILFANVYARISKLNMVDLFMFRLSDYAFSNLSKG